MGGGEVSTARETQQGPFPTWKGSKSETSTLPRLKQPGWVEDTPSSIGTPQNHHQVPN